MSIKRLTHLCGALCILAATSLTHADVIMVGAFDSGFVTDAGGSSKGDGTVAPPATFNYSVGQAEHFADGSLTSSLAFNTRKNYFVFDLSGVTDPIVAASMMLYMGPDTPPAFPGGEHGYESLDAFEDFALLETTDPDGAKALAGDLLAGNIAGDPTAFDTPADPLVGAAMDLFSTLGDGAVMGFITTTSADDDTFLTIDFTPDGITYLNGFLGDTVIIAGELVTIGAPDTTELIFGFTGPDLIGGATPGFEPVLTVTTVPEPSSTVLLVFALAIGICFRHKTLG